MLLLNLESSSRMYHMSEEQKHHHVCSYDALYHQDHIGISLADTDLNLATGMVDYML